MSVQVFDLAVRDHRAVVLKIEWNVCTKLIECLCSGRHSLKQHKAMKEAKLKFSCDLIYNFMLRRLKQNDSSKDDRLSLEPHEERLVSSWPTLTGQNSKIYDDGVKKRHLILHSYIFHNGFLFSSLEICWANGGGIGINFTRPYLIALQLYAPRESHALGVLVLGRRL